MSGTKYLMLFIMGMMLLWPGRWAASPVIAQSTGDRLPTRTFTPAPIPTMPAATPGLIPPTTTPSWNGRIVENIPSATEGHGSIFRVIVQGVLGIPVELRSGDTLITGVTGSKPEYGLFAAEFAPIPAGIWQVGVPSLGISMPVEATGHNLVLIEFGQNVAAPTETPPPTPTAWQGRLVRETGGIGVPFSRLLVQVAGLPGHAVQISTPAEIINTAPTGQKPDELGPDIVEFAGLTPAKYIIEPLGLNSRFEVELKPNTETLIRFEPQPLPPTPTATASPIGLLPTASPAWPTATPTPSPTASPTPTETPSPTASPTWTPTSIPTVTPLPLYNATPFASPTPVTRWLGRIEERRISPPEPAAIIVRVSGVKGLSIQLRNADIQRRCITGQGLPVGEDACVFSNIPPGQYLVAPEGLALSLPVTLFEPHEQIKVTFELEALPSGITGWQARVDQNTNGPQAVAQTEGIIRVRLVGQAGQIVALRSVRGTERFCEVAPNPILGGLTCEFGQLGPGVYLVEAINTGASHRLFVDGVGLAEIVFSPSATYATLALDQPAIVGRGAQPQLNPTATPSPLPTAIATRPYIPPSPTPTATAVPSPTPAFAWQGRVVERVNNVAGAIGVRAVGLKDHPVLLHSGGWQSPVQMTGSKPELGEYATEFGGLAQGEYIVELVDLAEIKVHLGPDQFLLVEFRYDFVE